MHTYRVHTVCNLTITRETWHVTSLTPLTDEAIEDAVRGTVPDGVTTERIDLDVSGTDRTFVAIEEETPEPSDSTVLDALYTAHAFIREALHEDRRFHAEARTRVEDAITSIGGTIPTEDEHGQEQPDRCPSTLGELRCELPTGHGRYHKHNAAGWEDANG